MVTSQSPYDTHPSKMIIRVTFVFVRLEVSKELMRTYVHTYRQNCTLYIRQGNFIRAFAYNNKTLHNALQFMFEKSSYCFCVTFKNGHSKIEAEPV